MLSELNASKPIVGLTWYRILCLPIPKVDKSKPGITGNISFAMVPGNTGTVLVSLCEKTTLFGEPCCHISTESV